MTQIIFFGEIVFFNLKKWGFGVPKSHSLEKS